MATEVAMDGAAEAVETSLLLRSGLPSSATWMRDEFPASGWREHPNFGQLAGFWQQVHRELRQQGSHLASMLDTFRNGDHDRALFARAFSARLQHYLSHLDTHHRVEDSIYFPQFRTLDDRLIAGFDLLETDHEIIHAQLVEVARSGEKLLHALAPAASEMERALDDHSAAAEALIRLLDRHLDDEEDLVIPVILKHGEKAVH